MSAAASPLAVTVGNLTLRNPVLTASGCFNLKRDLTGVLDVAAIGGIVTKTVTPKPRLGNPVPRIAEVGHGMLNSIGLMNEGLEGFLAKEYPAYEDVDTALIINIGGDDADEFARVAERFGSLGPVDALEINVSCPNVEKGTAVFAARPEATAAVVARCRQATDAPLWVKLSPESSRIGEFAQAAEEAGATALTVANSYVALAVDWRRRKPRLGKGMGGYTGPAVKPLSLRLVHEASQGSSLPIVGVGGVSSAEDVMEFLVAGATAVQVGTAYLQNPAIFRNIVADLEKLVEEEGIGPLVDWVGTLELGGRRHPAPEEQP